MRMTLTDMPITSAGRFFSARAFRHVLTFRRVGLWRYARAYGLTRVVWPASPHGTFYADPSTDYNQAKGDHAGYNPRFDCFGRHASRSNVAPLR